MNPNYDIHKLRQVLSDFVLASGATQNIFIGHPPSSLKEGINDFVCVQVGSGIRDRAAFGSCVSRIEMFAKNKSDGTENGIKLSFMYRKLCEHSPIKNDTYLFTLHPTIIQLGNYKNGYSVHAINIETLIKAI